MLRQVGKYYLSIPPYACEDKPFDFLNVFACPSYDLDMDTRLSEETTTLVESYTVSEPPLLGANPQPLISLSLTTSLFAVHFISCPTVERSKLALSVSRLPNACSSLIWSISSNQALPRCSSKRSRTRRSTYAQNCTSTSCFLVARACIQASRAA